MVQGLQALADGPQEEEYSGGTIIVAKKFPAILYVTYQSEGKDIQYFVAEANEKDVNGEHGERVGVYILNRVSYLANQTTVADEKN